MPLKVNLFQVRSFYISLAVADEDVCHRGTRGYMLGNVMAVCFELCTLDKIDGSGLSGAFGA